MHDVDEGRAVGCRNFIHVAHGFTVGLQSGHLAPLRIGLHELAQLLTGENFLLDLLGCFDRGTRDAFAVSVDLAEQVPPQLEGKVFDAAPLVFRRFDESFDVDRIGHLDKNVAGFPEKRCQPPQFTRFLRRTEENIHQRRPGGRGVFAEKEQLGDDADGPLQRSLDFDQVTDGVGFGFDEAPVEIAFFHQWQKYGGTPVDFVTDESGPVRIPE